MHIQLLSSIQFMIRFIKRLFQTSRPRMLIEKNNREVINHFFQPFSIAGKKMSLETYTSIKLSIKWIVYILTDLLKTHKLQLYSDILWHWKCLFFQLIKMNLSLYVFNWSSYLNFFLPYCWFRVILVKSHKIWFV